MSVAEGLGPWLASRGRCPAYWIAYSGGLDSHVLLHLCARLAQADGRYVFHAAHVHHGLQPAAEQWAEHCASVCESLAMPFTLLRVNAAAAPGESPEDAARQARYGALRGRLREGEGLLTAQHADDQAETLLLQLMRGAGLAGLAAMPDVAEFEPGRLLRPLLHWSRDELKAYAERHGLVWVEDPSNLDTAYDRNFVRQRLIPLLRERWPGAVRTIGRTARHCAEAQSRLERLADDLLQVAGVETSSDGLILDAACLGRWAEAEQRLVLRRWLGRSGMRPPAAKVLQRILSEVLTAAPDRNPRVAWSEGEVRRYRGHLYVMAPLAPIEPTAHIPWDGYFPLSLPGNGLLEVRRTMGSGIKAEAWRSGGIDVRYRHGGERCRLPGRQGSRELKKLLQEKEGIPPWIRERLPLVYIGGALAAVAGLWVCEPFAAAEGEAAVSLCWRQGLIQR